MFYNKLQAVQNQQAIKMQKFKKYSSLYHKKSLYLQNIRNKQRQNEKKNIRMAHHLMVQTKNIHDNDSQIYYKLLLIAQKNSLYSSQISNHILQIHNHRIFNSGTNYLAINELKLYKFLLFHRNQIIPKILQILSVKYIEEFMGFQVYQLLSEVIHLTSSQYILQIISIIQKFKTKFADKVIFLRTILQKIGAKCINMKLINQNHINEMIQLTRRYETQNFLKNTIIQCLILISYYNSSQLSASIIDCGFYEVVKLHCVIYRSTNLISNLLVVVENLFIDFGSDQAWKSGLMAQLIQEFRIQPMREQYRKYFCCLLLSISLLEHSQNLHFLRQHDVMQIIIDSLEQNLADQELQRETLNTLEYLIEMGQSQTTDGNPYKIKLHYCGATPILQLFQAGQQFIDKHSLY